MQAQAAVTPGADRMAGAERPLVGDPARGASVHSACFGCHGMERYVAPVTNMAATFTDSLLRASGLSDVPPAAQGTRFKGRITSLAALRDAVARRNDYLNPRLTPQEFEDVIAYLNAEYYKFPQ
jgi:mono/diheme cytochrome c family protein